MKDLQRFPRAPYGNEVICDQRTARSKDIGVNGICLLSRQPLIIEKSYFLELSLLFPSPIQTWALLKWYRKVKFDLFECGFQFKDLNKRDQKSLKNYIAQWYQKDIEQRKSSRHSIKIQVKGSLSCYAELKNINARGFCLILSEIIELNKIIYFILLFPDGTEIHIYGQVIWREELFPKVHEIGVCFWHIDSHNQKKIMAK